MDEMTPERAKEIVASVYKAPLGSSFNNYQMAQYDKARGFLAGVAYNEKKLEEKDAAYQEVCRAASEKDQDLARLKSKAEGLVELLEDIRDVAADGDGMKTAQELGKDIASLITKRLAEGQQGTKEGA